MSSLAVGALFSERSEDKIVSLQALGIRRVLAESLSRDAEGDY